MKILSILLFWSLGIFTSLNAQTRIFYADFNDINGRGGSDGIFSGRGAERMPNYETGGTWQFEEAYKGNECIRIGNSTNEGYVAIPAQPAQSNEATLQFRAGSWKGDNCKITFRAFKTGTKTLVGTVTFEPQEIKLENEKMNNYVVKVRGANENVSIVIQTVGRKKGFIDDISIYNSYPSATTKIGKSRHITFFSSDPVLIPTGLQAKVVTNANSESISTKNYAQAGETLPPSTAVIFEGESGEYPIFASTQTPKAAPEANLLQGSDTGETITSTTHYLYKLADDPTMGLGFYWDNTEGNSIVLPAHRAYLSVEKSVAPTSALHFDGQKITNINPITPQASSNQQVFDLSGRRITGNNQRGIRIISGKKTLLP